MAHSEPQTNPLNLEVPTAFAFGNAWRCSCSALRYFCRPLGSLFPNFIILASSELDEGPRFPTPLEQTRVEQAAGLAAWRGDLWAESAFAYSNQLWTGATMKPEIANAVQRDLENAVRYSPHRGDIWLMFAAMAGRYKWGYKPSSLLKMSYYTAPNDIGLIPLRLMISLRQWTDDPELQDLIVNEIRVVLTKLPDLRSTLSIAYRAASPEGKAAVEQAVSSIDAAQLMAITGKPR